MALRIACSGLVAANAGSISSVGFLVLDGLLARGHEIDFYSKSSYVYPRSVSATQAFVTSIIRNQGWTNWRGGGTICICDRLADWSLTTLSLTASSGG